MEITGATIGPDAWKISTIKNIKISEAVIKRSDRFNDLGKQLDPLPSLRDSCIQQGNAQINEYAKSTRLVAQKLRDSVIVTEEEIKSLDRWKENLEKCLEHLRKDIIVNRESSAVRRSRPSREKQLDGACDLLEAEKEHYKKLKRVLESQLRSVQKQLRVLDNARKRLKAALSERTRVLDLVCHTATIGRGKFMNEKVRNREASIAIQALDVNPLGPLTPEASQAIHLAVDAKQRSTILRKEVAEAIEQIIKLQKGAHRNVNDGLTQKVAETVALRQHLQMTSGEARIAINRGERWHYATDVARGYTLGPVSSHDFTTREKLDRPMVKIHNRHPGNQLGEAQIILEGNTGLQESMDAIGRNVGMLKLTKERIQADMRDKSAGAEIDSRIVRMRRRNANHRWVIGGLSC